MKSVPPRGSGWVGLYGRTTHPLPRGGTDFMPRNDAIVSLIIDPGKLHQYLAHSAVVIRQPFLLKCPAWIPEPYASIRVAAFH
jgi:hypothetical protein